MKILFIIGAAYLVIGIAVSIWYHYIVTEGARDMGAKNLIEAVRMTYKGNFEEIREAIGLNDKTLDAWIVLWTMSTVIIWPGVLYAYIRSSIEYH